jgi:adenosylcobinamide-GDP ribazoletransferase
VNGLRHYLLALQFFTRVPVTGALARWVGYSPQLLRASAGHFPGVGLLVGAVAALVYALLAGALPATPWTPLVAAILSTAATVRLTGGFHEDGLADLADGLGGSPERARALEIMKDSRVGSFGVLALLLAVLAKVGLLALLGSVGWRHACAALLLAHAVSRALPLLLIRLLPYVADGATSKSKPLADQIGHRGLLTAAVWALLALVLAGSLLRPSSLGAALLAGALACAWMWRLLRRRLQGFTGDALGATQQACELACYLGLALAA